MPDMLVKLYELPDVAPSMRKMKEQGVVVRRAIGPEKRVVAEWVAKNFWAGWGAECEVAFAHNPIGCFIAIEKNELIGFACHDATAPAYFGPTGVSEAARHRGVGTALLLAALDSQRNLGYGYAIIGGAGPTEFYARTVGAIPIPGSEPGIYRGMLTSK